MDFQIEILAELPFAMGAFEFLNSSVSFDVLLEVAHLAEGWTAVRVCTFVWFLTCVDPKMSKELAHALNDLIALLPFLLVMTLKEPILFFKIVLFFYKIEHVLRRIGYVVRVAKHSGIKLVALNDCYLVVWKDLVLGHEGLCQYILAWVKVQIIKTTQIDIFSHFILYILFRWNQSARTFYRHVSNYLKWSFYFSFSGPARL